MRLDIRNIGFEIPPDDVPKVVGRLRIARNELSDWLETGLRTDCDRSEQ